MDWSLNTLSDKIEVNELVNFVTSLYWSVDMVFMDISAHVRSVGKTWVASISILALGKINRVLSEQKE